MALVRLHDVDTTRLEAAFNVAGRDVPVFSFSSRDPFVSLSLFETPLRPVGLWLRRDQVDEGPLAMRDIATLAQVTRLTDVVIEGEGAGEAIVSARAAFAAMDEPVRRSEPTWWWVDGERLVGPTVLRHRGWRRDTHVVRYA